MRRWLIAALLIAACSLCLSAANYYARVPKDSKVFDDLRLLSGAGYLGGWTEPDHSMLRLEVAMLLSSGLPEFFDAQAQGGTSETSDKAAQRLIKELKDELTGIGAQLPGVPAPKPQADSSRALQGEDLKAEKIQAELWVIEDEVLADGGADAAPAQRGEPAEEQGGASISLDDLAAAQTRPAPLLRPVDLPGGEWRSTGHSPPEHIAAVEPDSPVESGHAPAVLDELVIELDAQEPVDFTESEPEQELEPGPDPGSGIRQPYNPERAAPDHTGQASPVDVPSALPAGNSADAAARPAAEALVPRPYRNPSGGGAAGMADGRDMNLLIEERTGQQAQRAQFSDRESPGPAGHYAVRDEQLGPPRYYHRRVEVDVQPFLDAQGQLMFRDSEGSVVSGTSTDLRLYWADAGLDFEHEDWAARIALNFNDRRGEAKLQELWAEFRDSGNGLYGRAGRSVLPFAERKGWFPTFSYARELGFTSANTIGLGWNQPGWGASVWVYDAPVETLGGGSSSLGELAFNLSLMSAPDDYSDESWRLAFAYMSELGGHERRLAAGPSAASVSGFNLSGGYTWGGGEWQLALDFSAALKSYSPGALDADGNGLGDKPTALALELVYSPAGMSFWGLRAERTAQYGGAAGTRWGLLYGQWLSEQMLARLELSRATYNGYSPGRSRDLALTADLNLVF